MLLQLTILIANFLISYFRISWLHTHTHTHTHTTILRLYGFCPG